MTTAILVSIFMTLVAASTPILLTALGELVVEKSGVLNLGVEGMMLCGAVAGFAVAFSAPAARGLGLAAAAHRRRRRHRDDLCRADAFSLTANQVATGLALTIFGIGASSLIGAGFVGRTITRAWPGLPRRRCQEHPLLRVAFGHDIVVYLSLALVLRHQASSCAGPALV